MATLMAVCLQRHIDGQNMCICYGLIIQDLLQRQHIDHKMVIIDFDTQVICSDFNGHKVEGQSSSL